MRLLRSAAGAVLFACTLSAFADTNATCEQTLTAPLQPRSYLSIDSRPAGLEIVATDNQVIRISCKSNDKYAEAAAQLQLHFSPSATGGKLSIEGRHLRHQNGIQVRIEVPRRTNLAVRMPAGDIKVQEVIGDKDIEIYAGQITISDHDWDYRKVNASVSIGQVNASAYNVEKGGFFRSIDRESAIGEYKLHAHVTTGQIDLIGRKERSDSSRKSD